MKRQIFNKKEICAQGNNAWMIGLFMSFACCALYAALFSFRTMPISDGWYLEYAWQINHGNLPYRDFEYLFMPLYMFFIAGFTKIFGYSIFAVRALGVVMFGGIGAALYCIFSKLFNNLAAMISAIVAALFLQSEPAQVFYDYIRLHDLLVFICTYYFISLSCQCYQRVDFQNRKYASFAGAFTQCLVPAFFAFVGIFGIIMKPISQHHLSGSLFLLIFCVSTVILSVSIYRLWRGRKLREFGIPVNALVCGIFAAAECMVKQSNGTLMIVMIAVFLLYCAIVLKNKHFLQAFYGFIVATLAVFGCLIVYLLATDTLSAFWMCCFENALSAKGGLGQTLFGWIIPTLQQSFTGMAITVVAMAIYISFLLYSKKTDGNAHKNGAKVLLIIGLLFAAWEWGLSEVERLALRSSNHYNPNISGYVFWPSVFLFFIYALYLLVCWCRKKEPEGIWSELFPAFSILGVIFAQGYGCGMSGGLSMSQVAIAYGLIAGFCIHTALMAKAKIMLSWLLITTFSLSGTFISTKTIQAYNWWGLVQNQISEHTERVDIPLMKGIKVRPVDKLCLESVYNDIMYNTEKGDNIYTFPHCPIFYTMTDRHSSTYSKVEWFDVSSWNSIFMDVENLKENPPKVIVYVELPEWVYEGHESAFSTYQTREMRDFLLGELIPAYGYTALNTVDLGNGYAITTYLIGE